MSKDLSKKEKVEKQNKRYSKQKKKNIVVSLNCGKVNGGYSNPSKSRASRRQPRTSKTKSNKLRKLKSTYNRIFRNSQKAKKENPNEKKERFCDKYPTFESYKKNYVLKEVGVAGGSSSTRVSSERKKELKERFNRGGLLGSY